MGSDKIWLEVIADIVLLNKSFVVVSFLFEFLQCCVIQQCKSAIIIHISLIIATRVFLSSLPGDVSNHWDVVR